MIQEHTFCDSKDRENVKNVNAIERFFKDMRYLYTLVLILYCTILGSVVDARTRIPKVLFLMSDSHDGRTLDPTDKAVFPLQYLPNLRRLADRSTNFVRTYAASPQVRLLLITLTQNTQNTHTQNIHTQNTHTHSNTIAVHTQSSVHVHG